MQYVYLVLFVLGFLGFFIGLAVGTFYLTFAILDAITRRQRAKEKKDAFDRECRSWQEFKGISAEEARRQVAARWARLDSLRASHR